MLSKALPFQPIYMAFKIRKLKNLVPNPSFFTTVDPNKQRDAFDEWLILSEWLSCQASLNKTSNRAAFASASVHWRRLPTHLFSFAFALIKEDRGRKYKYYKIITGHVGCLFCSFMHNLLQKLCVSKHNLEHVRYRMFLCVRVIQWRKKTRITTRQQGGTRDPRFPFLNATGSF